jgi:hypothetical protein
MGCAAVGIDDFEAPGHPGEDDIPSVAELVSRIASDAEKIIHECLSGLSR